MPRLQPAAAVAAACALSAAAMSVAPVAAAEEVPAPTAASGLVLNEIVYDDAATGLPDQVELYNAGPAPVDLAGWTIADEKRDSFGQAPEGTVLAPGEFLVLVKDADFPFGLGKGDEVVLFDPNGTEVDAYAYDNTAPLSVWARCPDGTGAWAAATAVTPGTANDCSVAPVDGSIRINEVDSQPADWVEFFNPGTEALDLTGYEIRDNSDDHRWRFPAGTQIAGGERLVVDEGAVGIVNGVDAAFRDAIGIGSADRIRLFDAAGALIDDTLPWQAHATIDGDAAAATLARCPDGVGAFVLAYATPGAPNACVMPSVAINEIESNGDATDWVEVANTGSTPVDLSGWTVMDGDPAGHAAETTPLPAGTVLPPGGYLVFDQPRDFVFGLGNGDTVTLRDANGNTVDEHVYAAHADGVWARCPDGTGDFVDADASTKGLRNACGNPVRLNEVESDGGSPDDWVELVNPTAEALDVSGIVVKDDDDAHAYTIPAGTSIPAGGYLVIDRAELGFGLGGGDAVRVFDDELLLDETTWGEGHAAASWGRCPDTTGAFAPTAEPTKGAANVCAGEIPVGAWPGSAEVRVVDDTPAFLEDSSGLDVQETPDGVVLWAVDNGEGRIWKLDAQADGSVTKADGWDQGKRVRFPKDAQNPGAAGPDTEGITVDGDGFVYVASERDNGAKGVNQNTLLKVDPEEAAGDLVAQQQWDLTTLLPAVGANLGVEAVQWVPDSALAGALFDDTTGAAYDPAVHPGHGDGLFLVAVEDDGHVYAFALAADGSATLVSEIEPGLAGVMALDWDSVRGTLWAVCDDGCQGRAAEVTLNGTAAPDVAHYARPAGMPDINNEGFATAPASLAVDGQRPVWWFADGFASQALRTGTLPGGENPGGENPGGENPGGENPGGANPPLPGSALVEGNRHGATVDPAVAARGQEVTVAVGAESAGSGVEVWLYSEPVRLTAGTLSSAATITVTVPADAALGAHRLAVYAADGSLVGWADLRVIAAAGGLAATGADLPFAATALALGLLVAGGIAVARRRRRGVGDA
ncbi:lamin tail domain-containing protein [Microbacterium sp. p3-SID336]|uniref:lamin tail domain-containing protein n=1 Tax=Microbacterium sp. p3-SID336 TaxID=2916212 RepID=UPI0021A2EBFA|nr:lamin tail domain-containing protein [Microbacterium sp. p3-SID336]MCT1478788.1 lamin tail domain-containing protein [Microbacterium sp. p3-SID336]